MTIRDYVVHLNYHMLIKEVIPFHMQCLLLASKQLNVYYFPRDGNIGKFSTIATCYACVVEL
jgi:hypothetical protein